ncbi:hypothetical protein LINPERHAP2_LOCUS30513 [Linum perenne]
MQSAYSSPLDARTFFTEPPSHMPANYLVAIGKCRSCMFIVRVIS